MKYRRYAAFGSSFCALAITAILFMVIVVEALGNGLVVRANEVSEEKPEYFVVKASRQWDKETFAVSGSPASLAWMLKPGIKKALMEDWKLLLVNKENLLPEGYKIETKRLSNGLLVDARIYDPLMEFLKAGNKEGCNLLVCSAYRPYERQVELYEADLAKYQGMGYSYEKACAITEETLAVPGASEHQAGLSVDIVTLRHQVLNDAFADTKAGKWLAEHAHEYGFILRYPKDKEEITGINYEPWHFRYVGKEAAEQIYELGYCLEEYVMLQNQLAILNISDKTKDY